MVERHDKFKGISTLKDSLLINELEANLKSWLDWCFLNSAGFWSDINIPTSGAAGGNFNELHLVKDSNYTNGQVWEFPRQDICYETGVDFEGSSNPIHISGVYIDNTFYLPTASGKEHYVDYHRGRIVFDTAQSTTAKVETNYSFRNISVQIADTSPIFKQIQYGSMKVESPHLTNSDNGEWTAKTGISRQQLPAIIIEAIPSRTHSPYELGNGALIVHQDVLFHIVSEDRYWRNQLIDVLCIQEDKTIYTYNTNEVTSAGVYPLDYRGVFSSSAYMYPRLVDERGDGGYRWKELFFNKINSIEMESFNPNLHLALVRASIDIIFGNI